MGEPSSIRAILPAMLSSQCQSSQTLSIAVEDGAFQWRLSCSIIDQFISHQSYLRWNAHQLHLNSVLAQASAQLFTFIV
jgi:hypothetical protein